MSSAGGEAIELAAHAGLKLDDWQCDTIIDASGERDDGRWQAPDVGIDVSRQNGKGGILEARELAGAYLWDEKVIIHSAHEQSTSSEHFRRLEGLIEGSPLLRKRLWKCVRGKGSEAIELTKDARILFKTRAGGNARGFTGDLIVLDEAMILAEAFMGNLIPTTSARSIEGNPQTYYTGSAVDQLVHPYGLAFARQRMRGLRGDPTIAWFEWSVPGEDPSAVPDEVLRDPEAWALANPAMGIRISPAHIERELAAMGARTFAVERLGIGDWPSEGNEGDEFAELWADLHDADSKALDPVCFAFDVRPDRSMSAIGVAGWREDGLLHVEPLDHRPGTGWVAERLHGLVTKHPALAVRCEGRGPAGSLVPEVEQLGVAVETANSSELAQGCGCFFDAVDQRTLRQTGKEPFATAMTAAVRGANRRTLGEAWAWSRKTSNVDISPLVACTLALWGSVEAGAGGGGFEWD